MNENATSSYEQPGAERRKYRRIQSECEVMILEAPGKVEFIKNQGKALNISRGGMKLSGPFNFKVGEQISMIVYYEGYDSLCLGEVVWNSGPNGSLYGVHIKRWSYIDPALQQMLDKKEPKSKPSFFAEFSIANLVSA